MEEMLTMLRTTADRTSDLVKSVRDDELALATPCREYDVKALINHLEWAASQFESVSGDGEFLPPKEYTGDFPDRVERMMAAWERPESWVGTSKAMGGMPKPLLAHMALTDLAAHGWDLSRALGRPYAVEETTAATLLDFAARMAPTGRQRGAFGEEVKVADDAPAFDRFLGLIGRDPAWKP
ncbi:TIGR03086 family metal-binding protein [Nonomuraea jiangxiensis]|uniref:TIGR03086 family protein n=1 Tax=Nonomuraea jiangxiensis TaxID=633440 RepID=A0A1G9B5I7_9ACTN|nr:TIGR03086 family metal-binding protein [Nonomuraea jiangxiensis]SDK34115.1 TIGR03086 family protein [Nonomuraea jiangxiensis]